MKKNLFTIILILLIGSCSTDKTDELTNTIWKSDNQELSFYSDEAVNYKQNNALVWSGVYKLYDSKSIHIYRAKAGSSNWPIEFTGVVKENTMELYNHKDSLMIFIKK